MRLSSNWENFLKDSYDIKTFYNELDAFIRKFKVIIPSKEMIFHAFDYVDPQNVKCVLFGEDPYPRITSACGVAFWDKEVNTWLDKTNGNSLKNILKALLVHDGKVTYSDSIEKCRSFISETSFVSPPQLFDLWLKQGVLLINTAMTFSGGDEKKEHISFWKSFHEQLIEKLNKRNYSPYYILWGKKAQTWEQIINKSLDNPEKIIKQGHPTFIHQFLNKDDQTYSPFTEIIKKTKIRWY